MTSQLGIGVHRTVLDAVTTQCLERPCSVAMINQARVLTYAEMDQRANRLAHYLSVRGVRKDDVVGLCVSRGFDTVIGPLAIWRAGAAYLPMDPSNPPARLAGMLRDARARVVLGSSDSMPGLVPDGCELIDLSSGEIGAQPADPVPCEAAPSDLAYVIYTSGSTGSPKGVEITHGSLANLAAWHQEAFCVTGEDRATQLAGLGFDAALWELWPYLAAGASVNVVDDQIRQLPEALRDWLVKSRITISFVPTPLAERMLALPWPSHTALRILLTGGDALRHYPPPGLPFELVNNYGPTECTVVATSGRVRPGAGTNGPPPIGWAIAGAEMAILDEDLEPMPTGMSGEICIMGSGLARGYRNLPKLTADKFVAKSRGYKSGVRMYRTGDIGRFRPDGQIDYLGRLDDQVKIQGFRVELSEITGRLNEHPDVVESMVLALGNTRGEKHLVAYLIERPDSHPTDRALGEFLATTLPEYMLPRAFVRLSEFPVTSNGKIDRAALTAMKPEGPGSGKTAAPESAVEQQIAAIVSRLLELTSIGRDENFFLLGGHSLFGAQLIVRLREAFGIEISLRTLFEAPTVRALAAEIGRGQAPERMEFCDQSRL